MKDGYAMYQDRMIRIKNGQLAPYPEYKPEKRHESFPVIYGKIVLLNDDRERADAIRGHHQKPLATPIRE